VYSVSADVVRTSAVRRIVKSVSLYSGSLIAAGTIRVLSVLLLVRAVSPAAFGTYISLWVVMWGVHSGADLGLGPAALRYAPECANEGERRKLFGTMITARTLVGIVLSAAVMVLNEPLARWATGSAENGRSLVLLSMSRPFAMVYEGLSDELRARDAMGKVSALVVVNALFVQGASLLLVVAGGLGLTGLIWGRAIGDALACGVALALCFRFVLGRPGREELRRLLAFGWPLGAMCLLGTLRGMDRTLIRAFTSLDDVATYELAARLVGPIGLSNVALGKVFEPIVYRYSQSRETPEHVALFLEGYVAMFAIVAMALSLLAPEAITLLAPSAYRGTVRILPALAFATVGDGLTHVAGIGADLAKRTRVWAVAAVITLAVGFTFAWWLVPRIGAAGVGLGWVAASLFTTVFCYQVARRVSGFVLPVTRALAVVLGGALLGTAAAWEPWPLPARLALLVGFAFATWRVLEVRWSALRAMW